MNKNKLAFAVLSTTVFASMASAAYAAPAGIYIGGDIDEYYSFTTLVSGNNLAQLKEKVKNHSKSTVYVDSTGKAATFYDIGLKGKAGALVDLDTHPEVFGDDVHDSYDVIGKDGKPTGDVVVPVDGDLPTVSDVTSVVADGKVTISGKAANATSVTITLIDNNKKDHNYDAPVKDGKFVFTSGVLDAGDWSYEVVSTNGEDESDVYEGTFKVAAPAELKVDSVSAITANSFKVKFNKAVEDTSKASFAVKQGGSVIAFQAATWSADKKEATLVKSVGKLVAADYDVVVSGLTTDAITSKVTVAAEAITDVAFVGSNLVQASNGQTATVALKVTNQYGEDVTKSVVVGDVTVTTSVGSAVYNQATGLITVDPDVAGNKTFTELGVKDVTLTVLHNASGKKVTTKLTVAATAAISSIDVAQPVLPAGQTKFVAGTGYELPVTAKNQYGETVKLTAADIQLNGALAIAKNATEVTNFTVDAEGKVHFDITAVAATKDVTVTFIIAATGESKSVTFKIYAPAASSEATLTAPTTKFTTANMNAGTAYKVPVSVVDQYGAKLTDDQVVAAANDYVVVSSNPLVVTGTGLNNAITITKDPKLGAVLNVISGGTKGTANIIFTVKSSAKTTVLPLTVVDSAAPAVVTLAPSSTRVLEGASTVVKAGFLDTYGDAITAEATGKYKVEYSVDPTVAQKVTIVAASNNQNIANQVSTGTKITANAGSAGSTIKVTAKLYNDADNNGTLNGAETVVDTKTFDLTIASANTALTYSIAAVPTLHANGAVDTDGEYAQVIKLTAKDASGSVISIPSSRIVGATSSNPSAVLVAKDSDGNYAVAGVAVPNGTTTATSDVRLLVEDTDGTVKPVTATVTVSSETLRPVALKAVNDNDTTTAITSFDVADKSVVPDGTLDELTAGLDVTHVGNNAATKDFSFIVEDQFGGTSLSATAGALTFAVTSTSGLNLGATDTVAVDSNGKLKLTNNSHEVAYVAGTSFKVTAATNNGLTSAVTVKLVDKSDVVAPTAAANFSAPGGKTVTITFNKAMDAASLVSGNFISTAGGTITSFTKAADNKSVTIVFTNALVDFDTVAINAAVKDLAGNTTATTSVIKTP